MNLWLLAGATVSVVADAVSSRRTSDRSMALQLMQQAGARITTSESLIYSLLGGSKVSEHIPTLNTLFHSNCISHEYAEAFALRIGSE
jgi:hypothetical protein